MNAADKLEQIADYRVIITSDSDLLRNVAALVRACEAWEKTTPFSIAERATKIELRKSLAKL